MVEVEIARKIPNDLLVIAVEKERGAIHSVGLVVVFFYGAASSRRHPISSWFPHGTPSSIETALSEWSGGVCA